MYKIKVNALHQFDLTENNIESLDSIEISSKNYHILKDNKSVKASIISSNYNKKLTLLK